MRRAALFWPLLALAWGATLTSAPVPEAAPGEVATWVFRLEAGERLEGEALEGFVLLSPLPREGPGYVLLSLRVLPGAAAGVRRAFLGRAGEEPVELRARVRFVPRVELASKADPPFLTLRLRAGSNARARYRLRVWMGGWRRERLFELGPGAERTLVFSPSGEGGAVWVEAWVEGHREESLVRRALPFEGGGGRGRAPGEFRLRGELGGSASLGGEPGVAFSLGGALSDRLQAGVRAGYPWRTQVWARGSEAAGSLYWSPGLVSGAAGLEMEGGGYASAAAAYAWGGGDCRWSASAGFRAPGLYTQGEYLEYGPGRWVLAVSGAYYGREGGVSTRIAWDAGEERASVSLRARWSLPGFSLRAAVLKTFPLSGDPRTVVVLGGGARGHGGDLSLTLEPEPGWRVTASGPLAEGFGYRAEADGKQGVRFSVGRRQGGWSTGAEARFPWGGPAEVLAWLRTPPLPLLPEGGRVELAAVPSRGEVSFGFAGEVAYPLADGEALLGGLLGWPLSESSLRLVYRVGDDLRFFELGGRYAPLSGASAEGRVGLFDPELGQLELSGSYTRGSLSLRLSGLVRFSVPVPPEVVAAAGGTRAGAVRVCLEGGEGAAARVGVFELGRALEVPLGACRRIPVFPGRWRVRLLALPEGYLLAEGAPREVVVEVAERGEAEVRFALVRGGAVLGVLEGEEVPPAVSLEVTDDRGRRLVVEARGGRFGLGPVLPGRYRIAPLPHNLPPGVRLLPDSREVLVGSGETVRVRFEVRVERQEVEAGGRWRLLEVRLPYDRLPPGARVPVVARIEVEGTPPKELRVVRRGRTLGVLRPVGRGLYRGEVALPEEAGSLRLELTDGSLRESWVAVLDPDAPWGTVRGFGLLPPEGAWVDLAFFAPALEVQVETEAPLAWEARREDREGRRWRIRFALAEPGYAGIARVRIRARLANGKEARLGGLFVVRR